MNKGNTTNTKVSVGQSLVKAFQAGWIAALSKLSGNPYSPDTEEYAQWAAGYRKYMKDANG